MAFDSLMDRLQNTFKKLKGRGKVNENDVKEVMREVKLALLEADVNFKVVKDFVSKTSEKIVGSEVFASLTPAQMIIKIVNEELIELLGGSKTTINYSPKPPTVIMMIGLQGAGKTTTCAKLGLWFKKQGKRPLLVATDVYRPAAIKQLQVVGDSVGVPVFSIEGSKNPPEIAKSAISHALKYSNDIVIIDTAGRLHIDDDLMVELENIKRNVDPTEIYLVLDSMTGQDATNSAQTFNERLDITGIVFTKTDSDARGGAILSVRAVTGKPVKFMGAGEKMTDLEQFFPDRIASRILGKGDVLSLIEKVQEDFDEKQAEEQLEKLRKNAFTLEDFLSQLKQIKKMGPMSQIASMLPGMNQNAMKDAKIDDNQLKRTEAIILSMTQKERIKPEIINASRKIRISKGSGTTVQEVNALLKQFDGIKKLMSSMASGKNMKMFRNMKLPF